MHLTDHFIESYLKRLIKSWGHQQYWAHQKSEGARSPRAPVPTPMITCFYCTQKSCHLYIMIYTQRRCQRVKCNILLREMSSFNISAHCAREAKARAVDSVRSYRTASYRINLACIRLRNNAAYLRLWIQTKHYGQYTHQ